MRMTLPAIALAVALGPALPAQAIGFLRMVDELGLTNEDYAMAIEEAATLYEAEEPAVGDTGLWTNPDTGSHGTVEIIEFDGKCVQLEHVFRSGRFRQVHTVVGRRCKAEDGRWLTVSE